MVINRRDLMDCYFCDRRAVSEDPLNTPPMCKPCHESFNAGQEYARAHYGVVFVPAPVESAEIPRWEDSHE